MKLLLIGGAGYIGSFLHPRLERDGFDVDICDLGQRGFQSAPVKFHRDCVTLTPDELSPYSHILWFGGHSSVSAAVADPGGALRNNCLNLVTLRTNSRADTKLIYASSASLYSAAVSENKDDLPASTEDQQLVVNINAYDMSKFVFDYMAQGFFKNFIGLRLGTVSGWSANMRRELIFNAMNLSALANGVVRVANPHACRSIVFLDDLYKAVRACVTTPGLDDGFFNLASHTATIGELGQAIARHHGAKLEVMAPSATYSFRLDTSKATRLLGVQFQGDLDLRCAQFVEDVRNAA